MMFLLMVGFCFTVAGECLDIDQRVPGHSLTMLAVYFPDSCARKRAGHGPYRSSIDIFIFTHRD